MEGWNQNNQNTNWNQWKIKGAPWRDNPCFIWSDGNQQPSHQNPNPVENQRNWPNRNQEGPNNHSNWSGMNQEGPNFQQNWPTEIKKGRTTGGIEIRVTGSIGTKIKPQATMFHPTRGTRGIKARSRTKGIRTRGPNPVSLIQSSPGPPMA